jgi:hypothetical protein
MTEPHDDEGFIDIRFALTRDEDGTYLTDTELRGHQIPEGTTRDDLQNIVLGFWEYPKDVLSDISAAINAVPLD